MKGAADPELSNQNPGTPAPLRKVIKFLREEKCGRAAACGSKKSCKIQIKSVNISVNIVNEMWKCWVKNSSWF